MKIRRLLVWSAAAAAGSLFVLLGPAVADVHATAVQACPASAYAMSLQALTGPDGADLTIHIAATTPGCVAPDTLGEVRVTVFAHDEQRQAGLDFRDVPTPVGEGTVSIGAVNRGQLVAASATVAPDVVLDGQTRALLRPDLTLALKAPRQILAGRAFAIGLTVAERNGDVGTSATLTASANGAVLATIPVVLPPGGHRLVSLPATFTSAGPVRIDASISAANPAEAAFANDVRSTTVDVTDFQVVPAVAVGPNLAGYGGQFNENVYAAISRAAGVTDANLRLMEQSVLALHPQFSRIFFAQAAFDDPDLMASFVRTVLFAQRTGTTINITWQGGTLNVKSGTVQKFAEVLVDLVVKRHVTNLRWLTIQNEPNSTKLTPAQYETQYRELDPYLANIRGQLRYMGGDLVQTNQRAWFEYMGTHMTDILDAYSIHVFWDYWDVQKLQDRLTDVRAIVDGLPEAGRKTLYVTEYGVRGLRTFNGLAAADPGLWMDGTPVTETNVSAFEHAWFDILSARLGYAGTSKWDTYFGRYDKGTQAYYMIGGPDRGWPRHPMYNLFYLLTATVKPGWYAAQLDSVPGTTRLMTAYTGGQGDWTLVGLDTAGALLNGASTTSVPYSVGGLPASRTFRLVVWNDVGDGLDGPPTAVTTDAAGTATFTAPLQGVFTLTTRTGTVAPRNTLPLPD